MEKLRELILFIAANSESDPDFGATKLNKILFYSDFLAYKTFGKSITLEKYKRERFGPVPKRLVQARAALERSKAAGIRERDRFGKTQKRVVALREPDLSAFSGEEIGLVIKVIEALAGANATRCSEITHQEICWKAASHGEEIPYESAFVSVRELSQDELQYAESISPSCS